MSGVFMDDVSQRQRRQRMPPCATCGHAWGDHARPPHIEADIDNGERWCFALTDEGECRCRNWISCRVCGGSGFVAQKRCIDDGYGEVYSCPACDVEEGK